ncbi:hypothetical protein JCM3765_000128 [Sporobolomyces pararoseus]
MSYYSTTLTPDEIERLRPLSSQLFPPSDSSIDYLIGTALTSLSISQDSLKRDLAYQHIDFRDKRKLENSLNQFGQELGKGRGKAKLEMTRSQVEELKVLMRSLKVASDRADEELKKEVLENPLTLPPRLSDSLYLSRSAGDAVKPQPLPSLESFVSRIFSSPSLRAQALATLNKTLVRNIPRTQDVIICKYSMTRQQLDSLRQERKKMTTKVKEAKNDEKSRADTSRAEIEGEMQSISDTLAQERSPSPELFSIPVSKPRLPQQSINPSSAPTAERSPQEPSFEPSSTVINQKKVVNLEDCRLSVNEPTLPSLEANQLESLAFFVPAVPVGKSTSISNSLEWNPLCDTTKIMPNPPAQPISKEREKENELRSAARELRNKYQEARGGNIAKELKKELKVELGTRLLDKDVKREEDHDCPDPFEFFDRSRSTISSNQLVPPDSKAQLEPTAAHNKDKTPPSFSPPQNVPVPFPPFPPPYTLYKRRAISLPPPSRSRISFSDSSATHPLEFNGKKLEPDEYGFIEMESEISEASPTKPVPEAGGEKPVLESTKNDITKVLLQAAELGPEINIKLATDEAQGKGGREEKTEKTQGKERVREDGSVTSMQPVDESNSSKEVSTSKVPTFTSEIDKLSQLSTSSRLSSSLDRFMISRGSQAHKSSESHPDLKTIVSKAAKKVISNQSSRPPTPSLPFPIPSFLSISPSQSSLPPLRVVIFDGILQMRPLYSALENQQFHLVHRPSRFSPSPITRSDPHLITSGTSCVLYLKLIDLIANAVREESPESTRQEPVFATLKRFCSRYNHILVIFEEQQASRRSSSSLKPDSYTPPILEGVSRLSQALSDLSNDTGTECSIHVVCSSGPEYSAEVTRKFASFVEREDEKETRPGVGGWGERSWLKDDPLPDETLLLKLSPLLNELNVCAILSFVTSKPFVELAQHELELSFASVCGTERISSSSSPLPSPAAVQQVVKQGKMVQPEMEWNEWIKDYSKGHFPSSEPPQKPNVLEKKPSDETVTGVPTRRYSSTNTPSNEQTDSSSIETSFSSSLPPFGRSSPSTSSASSVPSVSTSSNPVKSTAKSNGLPQTPEEIYQFYQDKGYLPAPNGQFEGERLRTIKRYGLDKPERKSAIDRICRIVKAHFKTKTVIITLVLEDRQVLVAETGWIRGAPDPPPDAPPRNTSLESSLCRHAVTRVGATEPFIVPDASRDFRFEKNPYNTTQGGTLAFYASANISVPTFRPKTPPETTRLRAMTENDFEECPEELPVGSLCLIDDSPKQQNEFSNEDKQLLKDLAYMVGQEFKLGFESAKREVEQARSDFLGGFLDSTLITPASSNPSIPPSKGKNIDPLAACNLQQQRSAPSTLAIQSTHSPLREFGRAAGELKKLTKSTAAAFFDLRNFRAPLRTDYVLPFLSATSLKPVSSDMGAGRSVAGSRPPSPRKDEQDPMRSYESKGKKQRTEKSSTGMGRVYLLGGAGSVDWEETSSSPSLLPAIVDALERFYRTNQTEFDATTGHSALEHILPPSTTASCIVPVFDIDGSAALLLVLVSDEPHFQFTVSDKAFVQNVGAVAMSAMLRQRALEADRAKLAFVSQISHELRTPLHGINSQVELIREFASPQQLLKLAPLLDVADVCLESLRSVLDDTLDFSKLSNNSPEEIEAAQKRSLARHDLESLAEDVTKAVWVRKKRVDLVSADAAMANGKPSDNPKGNVDVILEVEEREWGCWVDAGGMKRVLLNILGNALKFTKDGYVKLSIAEAPVPASIELGPNQRVIELVIEDTGRGMSEEFLRDGKLFTPFVQENPFANGAGLGMSICDTIIRRMGGRLDVTSALGEGTTVRILVPLEFCQLDEASLPSSPILPSSISSTEVPPPARHRKLSTSTSFRRRVISDELTSLFNPGQPLASPFEEQSKFDFSKAVSNAQASLIQPGNLKRIPSSSSGSSQQHPRKPSFLGRTGTDEDFIDEMAKLSVGTASSPQPTSQQPANGDFFSLPPSSDSLAGRTPSPQGDTVAAQARFIPSSPSKRFAERVRVLIADDNAIGRSILTKLFSGKGIDFAQAENGQEAVDVYAAEKGRFNLILADVQMPILDGIQASHEIRKFEKANKLPRCRIIALTGFAEDHEQHNSSDPSPDGTPRDAVDSWLVKGGKSLAVILREIKRLEEELITKEIRQGVVESQSQTTA